MRFLLDPNIGLRSWWRTPYAYYIRGERDARRLTKEEYDILSQCDGTVDLPTSPTLERLAQRGFLKPFLKGDQPGLAPWQKMECDNRYFPAMNWMITGKCNYNCLHCFNAADNAHVR